MTGFDEVTAMNGARRVNPVHVLRMSVGMITGLLTALPFDLWFRWTLLNLPRRDERAQVAALNRVIRTWGRVLFAQCRMAMGLTVRVEGTVPATGRYLVVSNHQSSIDIPALISVLPGQNLKFVAIERLRAGKPAVSVALRNGGFAFVDQRSLRKDLAALKEFARGLERFDGSPLIFPEGRRTDDGSILPFRWAGAEIIRRTARLPILPVTIEGLAAARTLRTYHRAFGSHVTIRISEPIPFEETERDPKAVFQAIERTIRANSEEIRLGRPSTRSTAR